MDEQNNLNPAEKNGSAGPIVAVLIILALVILGGLYFWDQREDGAETMTDETLEFIDTQSELDGAASIEADLNATDVENLDSEINAS